MTVDLDRPGPQVVAPDDPTPESEIWRALVLGTRDYVRKCGLQSVLLGLSGGSTHRSWPRSLPGHWDLRTSSGCSSPLPTPPRRASRMHARLQKTLAFGRAVSRSPLRWRRSRASSLESLPGFPGHHRGEPAGQDPGGNPDGPRQQVRLHAALHREQIRGRGRLLDPLWGYGRGPCSDRRRLERNGLQGQPMVEQGAPDHPRPGAGETPSAELRPGQLDQEILPLTTFSTPSSIVTSTALSLPAISSPPGIPRRLSTRSSGWSGWPSSSAGRPRPRSE